MPSRRWAPPSPKTSLQLLWRTAPEPILAFDGDSAGQKAAHRAAHLALPHLKPGHSLRFAFLPAGRRPRQLHRRARARRRCASCWMRRCRCRELLWRAETEGKDFSTPERRAGLEQRLREIVAQITDGQGRRLLPRAAFDERVFESFKRRARRPRRPRAPGPCGPGRTGSGVPFQGASGPVPGTPEAVSPPSRASRLARPGGRRPPGQGNGTGRLLAEDPESRSRPRRIAGRSGPVTDPSLDRLRRELLNLAASGSSLEKAGVQTHFARAGNGRSARAFCWTSCAGKIPEGDPEARFMRAAQDLREMGRTRTSRHGGSPSRNFTGSEST